MTNFISVKIAIWSIFIVFSLPIQAKTSLVLWHSWTENMGLWQKIQTEFNSAQSDIILHVKVFEHEDMKQAIIRSSFQQKSADMLLMPSDWLGYHNVMKFSAVPNTLLSENISADIIAHTRFEGDIRGIPLFQGNHLLFMYNKSLVTKPASTWAELIAQHKTRKNKQINTLAVNYSEMFWFVPFMTLFNGFPVAQNEVTLNSQATIDALNFYKQLTEQNIIHKACTYDCVSSDFYQGKYRYSMAGSWAYKSAKQALGDNLGIASFPKMNGQELTPMRGNIILAFPNLALSGAKKNSLMAFSQFIQQEKYQQLMFDEMGLFPVNKKVMTRIKPHLDSDTKLSLKQFNKSKSLPASTSISAVWNGMYKGFSLFMDNEMNAEEAAIYMQKSVSREQAMLNRTFD